MHVSFLTESFKYDFIFPKRLLNLQQFLLRSDCRHSKKTPIVRIISSAGYYI